MKAIFEKIKFAVRWFLFRCWLASIGAAVGGLYFLDGRIEIKKTPRDYTPVAQAAEVMTPDPYDIEIEQGQVKRWAREATELHRVPFALYWSILNAENGKFSPTEVSTAGAVGLAQVMPDNATLCDDIRKPGAKLTRGKLADPKRCVFCGAQLLRRYYDQFGNWYEATTFYNAGKNGLDKNQCKAIYNGSKVWGYSCTLVKETHDYIRRTFGRMEP